MQLTISGLKVVVIDDASTDSTWDLISNLPEEVIKVRLPYNAGPGYARNVACTYTSSDYVLFLDADDYVSHDYYTVLKSYSTTADVVLTSWAEVCDGITSPQVRPLFSADYYRSLLGNGILQPIHSVVIRRHLFEEVGKFASGRMLCEDFDLWLRLFRANINVEAVFGITAYYVRASTGRSRNVRSTNRMVAKLIFREIFSGRLTPRQLATASRKFVQLVL